jgi:ABC-type antimicrobial peptide transport system permease subunit
MIGLEGLTLATGRHLEAGYILRTFASAVRDGLIPAARQTHEIGIRMALGAGRRDVLSLVLRMGLRLVVLGIVIGLATSLALARVISSQLWGVSAHDPLTLASVAAVLLVTGVVAAWVPALRATRVDPLVALRYE